jgi:hypothetical protein
VDFSTFHSISERGVQAGEEEKPGCAVSVWGREETGVTSGDRAPALTWARGFLREAGGCVTPRATPPTPGGHCSPGLLLGSRGFARKEARSLFRSRLGFRCTRHAEVE